MRMKAYKRIFLWIFFVCVCFAILWPVYWIVRSSFAKHEEIFAVPVLYLPINLTMESYRILLNRTTDTWKYITDTVILTGITLILTIFLCALAGYSFARTKSRGIRITYGFILLSAMIPGAVTIIPLMVLWRTLRLTDTYLGLAMLYFSSAIPFSVSIFFAYISQIPKSLEEAAWIDGTGVLGAFLRIIFPLLKPISATLFIINFITCVNEFFIPLIFATKNIKVLSMLVFHVPRVNEWQEPWGTISASGVILMLPTVLFILFFEKNIMEGLMMGSLKQ